jgi:hypothetical protein
MNEREEAFVRRFIIEAKQQRYLGFLSNPKLRRKFLNELYHRLLFKSSLAIGVPNRDSFPERLERLLRVKWAGSNVYVISPSSNLDQRWMPLREALDEMYESDAEAIGCCRLGELAYYKSEDGAWVLQYDGRKPHVSDSY